MNPILYHYRRGVFQALEAREDICVVFASGVGGRDGIAAMKPTEIGQHVILKNSRLGRLEWQRGLFRHICRGEYQHIVFLGDVTIVSTWFYALFARVRGIRVYFWTIGWHRPEAGIKRAFRLAFYRLADRILLYGSSAARIGLDMGVSASKLAVIGNSIAPAFTVEAPALNLPRRNPGEVWLGAVIRMTAVKRLDLLVSAASLLRKQGTDARLLLVGDGPELASLRRLADLLGVPLVTPGAVYGAQGLARVHEMIDITVVPAAVGLTAIQSLMYGVPVISDDEEFAQMPEWEAIIPGSTGELYKAGDEVDLARAIRRVLGRLDAPGDVAAACKAHYVSHWSPEAHAERIARALMPHV